MRASLKVVFGTIAAAALVAGVAQGGAPGGGRTQEPDGGVPDKASKQPIVIGHRGASGYRPEHTLAAYELAIDLGADFIEPDLVSTRDGVLVARHENEISATTDVENHPEFAARRTTKVIDGVSVTGWFTEDFTLAELKTLRATERISDVRPDNAAFDGLYEVPTLQEVIDLARREAVGIYPETKHPTYFDGIGLSLEEPLVAVLESRGYRREDGLVFIQSFEVGNLKDLSEMTRLSLVQLVNEGGRPYDFTVSGDPRTYADLVTPAGLAEIATYAGVIGVNKNLIVPRDGANRLEEPTDLVEEAHRAGLLVHAWTFRNENTFLPEDFRQGNGASPVYLRATGNAAAEYKLFYDLGIDGLFTDNPDTALAVRGEVFAKPGARPRAREPILRARAILPSDAYQPGPPSGAFIGANNGVTPPFPGQPIPGFSAVLDAGRGEFWAMPDNGFGAKTNSGDFLLRLYRIRPDFETERGGSGSVDVLSFLQLRDPEGHVPFVLFRPDRLLTGADFDLESVRRARDGTFWFGEEFGPFLLHTDASGRVLEAPVPLPGVQSPQNPFLPDPDAWTIPASRGFEGMARSVDGTRLYPVLEGALRAETDPRRRIVNEFDLRRGAYTGRTWQYRVDAEFPNAVIGDFTALDRHRFVLIERDDDQGLEARQKKIYLVDLRQVDAQGYLRKLLVLDLLRIPDPDGISLPARAGEFGVGDPFSFPLQSVESLEVLEGERLLIANDNNYPGSDGRWVARDRPDDTELIIVDAPALR
jgi:glycerophosphoryl diester phosphodiesterase